MKIVVISSSMRGESQSLKVSNWLAENINGKDADSEVLDLHKTKLPIYDVGETSAPNAEKLKSTLESADGFVFVSPEWNGMMSHGLVNMMHYVGTELANKPVMLVGVSGGRNGAYPLSQMRNMGYKNNHFVVSPENLVIQDVSNVMNDNTMADDADDFYIKNRANYAVDVLIEYSKALQSVRKSGVIDLENFQHGM